MFVQTNLNVCGSIATISLSPRSPAYSGIGPMQAPTQTGPVECLRLVQEVRAERVQTLAFANAPFLLKFI
jgi:hypothetical protein